jgi:hypothetical protein
VAKDFNSVFQKILKDPRHPLREYLNSNDDFAPDWLFACTCGEPKDSWLPEIDHKYVAQLFLSYPCTSFQQKYAVIGYLGEGCKSYPVPDPTPSDQ